MKKRNENISRYRSITEIHKVYNLPKPKHPLISLIRFDENNPFNLSNIPRYDVIDFYKIAFSKNSIGRLKYGQDYYDFDEGTLLFTAPNQLVGEIEYEGDIYGYILFVHPDLFLGYPLAKNVKDFGFFSYSVNEALHVSDNEKEVLLSVFRIIDTELNNRVDEFSQGVLIAQLELLLNYANRFYKRQFITRKVVHHDVLDKLESILDHSFSSENTLNNGIPTVQYLANQMHLTPGYLGDLLRSLIGLNVQQYIHLKLIEKAKERLSTTDLTVSEIAYELGFEHSQSFSKLFKQKTNQSPLEFRAGFAYTGTA